MRLSFQGRLSIIPATKLPEKDVDEMKIHNLTLLNDLHN